MNDKTAYEKILKARTSLVIEHPFFASLALRLKIREDPTCQTAWTDGQKFCYNPDYVKNLPPEKLKGLAAHTVMHPACAHHKRRNNRDPKAWNRACDYAINPILLDAGIVLPDGFLFDESFRDKSADAIYELLTKAEEDNSEGNRDNDQEPEAAEKSLLEDTFQSQEGDLPESVDDDNEPDAMPDPGKSGEIRDSLDQNGPGDSLEPETDWDEALVQAYVNARSMGKLPRGIELFVEKRINPKLPWTELLARFIERAAKSDYSWSTPNRRYIHQGLYFPSLKNHELSEIAVAVDTSGSIQAHELEQFSAELSAIMENHPSKIHLLYCDMSVSRFQTFEQWDLPICFDPKGGGGTDFRPVFDYLDHQYIFPACLIFLTDMECNLFPVRSPTYPVLWVKSGDSSVVPPFGEVIPLDSLSQ